MVRTADRVIVLTDSSKFGKKSFVRYADISMVHMIIMDNKVDIRYVNELEEKGVEVINAD